MQMRLATLSVHKSRERTWNRGDPKESNFGPYLFLVMINDLPTHLHSNLLSMFVDLNLALSLYADDVYKILSYRAFARLEAICNYSVGLIVHEWCNVNDLKLNISKIHFVQF
jgi:hypothetical protein